MHDAIERLTSTLEAPADIARALGVSLERLARDLTRNEPLESIRAVALLNRFHLHFLLDRLKLTALGHLSAIITDDTTTERTAGEARVIETRRRACVDLLRVNSGALEPQKSSKSTKNDDPPPDPEEEARRKHLEAEQHFIESAGMSILEALEKLGEQSDPNRQTNDVACESPRDVRSRPPPGSKGINENAPVPRRRRSADRISQKRFRFSDCT